MRPYRAKGSDIWYVPVYDWDARRWAYISSRSDDLETAKRLQRKLSRDAVDPKTAAADQATIRQALDLIVLRKQSELAAAPPKGSPATIVYYTSKAAAVNDTLEALPGKPTLIRDVATAATLDLYVEQRRKDGAHVGTIDKELSTICLALRLAKRKGWWAGDLEAIRPDLGPTYVPKTRVLSQPDALALLQQLSPGASAVFAFALATSADLGDFWRTRIEDVGAEYVHVRGTKNAARNRVVPIVAWWQAELLEWALRYADGPGELLFRESPGYRWVLNRAARRAGVPQFSPKDLRRTCCTWLLAGGMPKEHVRKIMGHVDDRMIDRVYDQTTPEDLRRLTLGSSTGCREQAGNGGQAGQVGLGKVPDFHSKKGWLTGLEPATPGVTGHGSGLGTRRKVNALQGNTDAGQVPAAQRRA